VRHGMNHKHKPLIGCALIIVYLLLWAAYLTHMVIEHRKMINAPPLPEQVEALGETWEVVEDD